MSTPNVTYSVIKSGYASKPWAVAKTLKGDTTRYKVSFHKFKLDAVRDAAKRNSATGS